MGIELTKIFARRIANSILFYTENVFDVFDSYNPTQLDNDISKVSIIKAIKEAVFELHNSILVDVSQISEFKENDKFSYLVLYCPILERYLLLAFKTKRFKNEDITKISILKTKLEKRVVALLFCKYKKQNNDFEYIIV